MPSVAGKESVFSNRDLGWLSFNERVLCQASDPSHPLLERVRFLSIFSSNLDEFYMKRVGRLKNRLRTNREKGNDRENLTKIVNVTKGLLNQQADLYEAIRSELKSTGALEIVTYKDLDHPERDLADAFFDSVLFSVLTPLSVDVAHPFPHLSNLSSSIGVFFAEEEGFARLKVPKTINPWLIVNTERSRFLRVADLIHERLGDLFVGQSISETFLFRVTRNAEVEVDEEEVEDIFERVEEEVRARRFAEVIRVESFGPLPDRAKALLMEELDLSESDFFEIDRRLELDMGDLFALYSSVNTPGLKYKPMSPKQPAAFQAGHPALLEKIKQGDLFVHHPFDDFSSTVEQFIEGCASDPKTLAIKMTLYRTGDSSPIVQSLLKAASRGIQVVVLIELKARFDEERNLFWASQLEDAGIHVVYGIVGLKTHCKMVFVVRNEGEEVRAYAHIGTGNYNRGTARTYTDFGVFTADPKINREIAEVFHILTGRSQKRDFEQILVSPLNLRSTIVSLIENELANKAKGLPAQVIAKFNNMDKNAVSEKLVESVEKGLDVQLLIRGYTCLDVTKLGGSLKVQSTIGRFLEHSRVYHFRNGQDLPEEGLFFVGSADFMHRNLENRIEVLVPIQSAAIKKQLWSLLCDYRNDQTQTWDAESDVVYKLRRSSEGEPAAPSLHERLAGL